MRRVLVALPLLCLLLTAPPASAHGHRHHRVCISVCRLAGGIGVGRTLLL